MFKFFAAAVLVVSFAAQAGKCEDEFALNEAHNSHVRSTVQRHQRLILEAQLALVTARISDATLLRQAREVQQELNSLDLVLELKRTENVARGQLLSAISILDEERILELVTWVSQTFGPAPFLQQERAYGHRSRELDRFDDWELPLTSGDTGSGKSYTP